jgi:hypothetical protein
VKVLIIPEDQTHCLPISNCLRESASCLSLACAGMRKRSMLK